MKAYLIRRFLIIPITLIGISIITFGTLQLMPGSPAMLRLMKLQGQMSTDVNQEEVIQQALEQYGLDKPVWQQYLSWMGRMVMLDFGTSTKDGKPVLTKIVEALPYTLQLNIISIFLVYLLAIPIGIFSATHTGTYSDRTLTVFLFVLYSIPSFWLAMILIYFFATGRPFEWFPVYGFSSDGAAEMGYFAWFKDRLWHLILPVICMTYAELAAISRYTRADLIEQINQDYVRTARAYGFRERTVVLMHAMRNSLITLITLFGTILPLLIAGTVIIEQIFSIPGMGRLLFESILSRDYPTWMGILTMSALLTLVGFVLSDILYALADPRIRFE